MKINLNQLRQHLMIFVLLLAGGASKAQEEKKQIREQGADALLLAEKRLELSPKQKVAIKKIHDWTIKELDWNARNNDELNYAKYVAKKKAVWKRSLTSALKLLTPKQAKLWHKSQAPDPKTPKPEQQ